MEEFIIDLISFLRQKNVTLSSSDHYYEGGIERTYWFDGQDFSVDVDDVVKAIERLNSNYIVVDG